MSLSIFSEHMEMCTFIASGWFYRTYKNISFVFDLIYAQLSASRNIKMTPDHPFLLNYKNHANIFIAASLTAAHKTLVILL